MSTDLFAGIPVSDFAASLPWYERFLGMAPSFFPTATEAVWAVGEHAYVYIEQVPERAGGSMHMLMVDDVDAVTTALAQRGLEPARTETYEGGVRKSVYRDPDGNELSYGGVSAAAE